MSRRPIGTNGKAIRIIARPPTALTPRRAGALVGACLRETSWGRQAAHRTTRFDDDAEGQAADDLLVEVAVPDAVGSPRYAKRAHDLVQRLYDTGAFTRVEADIPVPAFDPEGPPAGSSPRSGGRRAVPRSAGTGDCSAVAAAADPDWALRAMRVPEALALIPPARAAGKGIRIGHPDSGYSDHYALGLGQLDRQHDRDVVDDDDEALDPLKPPKKTFFNPLPNPGHGTSTASVIVGQGDGSGFHGVATAATLVPIRATESVIQVFDGDVAKAVRWARTHGCLVVSMSLGGKGFFGLQDAIGEAVDAGMIVLAAAGNQVGFVTAPASYDNCIAVAASDADGRPWAGSSHGGAVDVTAPGSCVWAAQFDWGATPPPGEPKPVRVLSQTNGTSYAVAHTAGIAALWLAKHGHAALVSRFGAPRIQATFLAVLRRPGVCRQTPDWNSGQYGAGVIDAEALLREPLPPPFAVAGPRSAPAGAPDDTIGRLAAQTASTRQAVAAAVDAVFGAGSSDDEAFLRRFEGELVYLAMADPTFRAVLAAPRGVAPGPTPRGGTGVPAGGARDVPATTVAAASPQLRDRLR
jgi:hypothetical protein